VVHCTLEAQVRLWDFLGHEVLGLGGSISVALRAEADYGEFWPRDF